MRLLILASLIASITSHCFNADIPNVMLNPGDIAVSDIRMSYNDSKTQCGKIGGQLINANTQEKIDAVVECEDSNSTFPVIWTGGGVVSNQTQWSNGQNISYDLFCTGDRFITNIENLVLQELKQYLPTDLSITIIGLVDQHCLALNRNQGDVILRCACDLAPKSRKTDTRIPVIPNQLYPESPESRIAKIPNPEYPQNHHTALLAVYVTILRTRPTFFCTK